MMFMKIFMKIKICLILMTIQKTQNFLILSIKMKDEVIRKIISEFVGLKSKIYSLVVADSKKIKKAKEVNENVVNLAFCLIKT